MTDTIDPDAAREERAAVVEHGRRLLADGLTTGTGGNVSALLEGGFLAISPTGMPYDEIGVEDVPVLDLGGDRVLGEREPSSELPMHRQVYRERGDVGGVVHTHSPYATTFAALREPVEASHYLVAFAGDRVPVASYETYGTEALGSRAVEALGEAYDACLLANHGVLAVGGSLADAYETALMVEYAARIHYQARAIGEPALVAPEELETLRAKFETYGQGNP